MSEAIHRSSGRPAGRWRRALLGILVLAALGLAGGFQWLEMQRALRAPLPITEGTLSVAGLEAGLEIVRDRRAIPHVRAANEADAWFGLGFVHAQDRLGQLLWLRRTAEGRTAAVLGLEGLPADRRARTLGLKQLAERDLEQQSPATRRVLAAYAAGVNARLDRIHSGQAALPLGTPPEEGGVRPWSPSDSLALLKLHAFGLGGAVDEIVVLEQMVRRLGPVAARPFFPKGVGIQMLDRSDDSVAATGRPASGPVAPLRQALGLAGRSIGSSAWLVGAGLTRRGGVLLAADAHFAPQVPPHLYEAHLRAGRLDVAGATLPGIPAFWLGFTPEVAWAATHAPAVVADLVAESLHPTDPSRYHAGRGWRSMKVRVEEIAVAGAAPEQLTVRETRHGPLVHELLKADRPLALRWTGSSGGGLDGLLGLVRARDAADVRSALHAHHEPVLSLAYADRSGAGGVVMAGAVPDRRLPSGLQPVPARDPAYAWNGDLGREDLPSLTLSEGRSWLIAADQPLAQRGGSIEFLWRSGVRAERIEKLLQEAADAGPIDLAGLVGQQFDAGSARSPRVIAAAVKLVGARDTLGRESREVLQRLEAWDGRSDASSSGAAAYHVFLELLIRDLLEPSVGEELLERYLALPRVPREGLVEEILLQAGEGGAPELPWTLPTHVSAAVRNSLRGAWLTLSVELGPNRDKWVWGRLHQLRFRPLRPGGALPAPGLGPFPFSGDGGSIAVGEYAGGGDFATRVAAMYRLAADAGDLDHALTNLVPGQSEHAGVPHNSDGVGPWLAGRSLLLSTSDPVIEDGPVARLVLVPEP